MNEIETKTKGIEIFGCVRRLSNAERVFLWSAVSNVTVVARIAGDVNEEKLKRALNTVRRMHPLAGAKVSFDEDHDAWFSTENVPKTILRIVPRISETQWSEEIQREHLTPFEPEKGPLIRFVLLYSPQVSELIAYANHSICDGVALANLIRDILVCYAHPEKNVQVIHPPSGQDYLPKTSLSKFIEKENIDSVNDRWRKRPHYFSQNDFHAIHDAIWGKIRYGLVILQLELEETSDLISRCREHGITIVSAVTASFFAAYQDVRGPFPDGKGVISTPVDLRRHLKGPIGDVFCLFAGGFNLSFSYNREKTFWENAQELHKMIETRVKSLDLTSLDMENFDQTLIDACFGFAPYVKLIPEAFVRTENLSAFAKDTENVAFGLFRGVMSGLLANIANTNLGRMDYPENCGDLRLDRMFFVPPACWGSLILGGVGVSGRLVFSLNYIVDAKGVSTSIACDMIRIRNRALEYLGFPEKANDRAM